MKSFVRCALLLVPLALLLLWRQLAPASATAAAPVSAAMSAPPPARVAESAAPAAPAVPPPLFAYAPRPANADALERVRFAPTQQVHYVTVNQALFRGKDSPFWQSPRESTVRIPLPDGTFVDLAIARSELLGADRFVTTGHVAGRPGSAFVLSYNQGAVHALIDDLDRPRMTLRYGDGQLAQFFEVDDALTDDCGGEVRLPVGAPAERRAQAQAAPTETGWDPRSIAALSNPARPRVDVMMVATQAVLTAHGGSFAAVQGSFDAAIAQVNLSFTRSEIPVRLRLVHVAVVNYDEQAGSASDLHTNALRALQRPSDGLIDGVHQLRDQYGADIVLLSLQRNDADTAGLAYLLNPPSINNPRGWNSNPDWAFGVVEHDLISSTYVLDHEIGHLFGCSHNREDAGNDASFSYSYGHRFTSSDGRRWRTIMSYDDETPGMSYRRVPYFSNPDVVLTRDSNGSAVPSTPVGVAEGQPNAADNALAITETSFEVSQYRDLKNALYGRGRMIGVSTRAWAGADQEALVAGFIVEGNTPKRVLVRGGGPSLSQAGVADALADPTLNLHSLVPTVQLLRTNDNWNDESNPSRAELIQLDITPGSNLEPAVIMTLNPGVYTATIAGRNNTTGLAIAEIYEMTGTGNRLHGLSTRGYVGSSNRAMIGGFIVDGTPGQTKRIVIRVNGPSLASSGITTPLSDPILMLFNEDARPILVVDDFSGDGTTSGDRQVPTINTYTEQQISAFGFAPSDRREPVAMVDLEPGLYTVAIFPFESSTQPARPGVALLEVYEINDR